MNIAPQQLRRARVAACMVLSGALAQCSSTPPPVTVAVPPTPPVVVAAEPAPDLSAVAPPDGLALTVRSPSPRATINRLGERLGLRELVSSLEEQVPSVFGDDEGLAHAIDLDAPVDIAIYAGRRQRVRLVIAFGALSMPRAEDALAAGHRLTPLTNGTRRIERSQPREGNAGPECVLAPAYGSDAHAARVVCADHFEDIEPALAFLTRTLPRSPLAADAGDIVLEAAPDQLRARFTDGVRRATERMEREVDPSRETTDAQLVEQIRAYVHGQVSPTLTRALADLDRARLSLRFADGATRIRGEVGLRAVGAPIIERLFGAVRGAHPSAEVLNRLAPGATSYFAGAGSLTSMRPELDLLAPVVTRLVAPASSHLAPADVTALRNVIHGVLHIPGYDHFVTAAASNVAQDNTRWTLTTYQLDAPAAQSVTAYRALLTALRRPAIARYVNTELHINPATIRTPATPGLPAGTLRAVLPIPATAPEALRQALRSGSQFELLLVPDGNNLWIGYGANVLAHYREARANHPPPGEIPNLTADNVVFAGITMPVGIAHLIGQFDPGMGRAVERGFQSTPNGNAPLSFSVTARQGDQGAELAGEFVMPDTVLRAIGGMFRQGP